MKDYKAKTELLLDGRPMFTKAWNTPLLMPDKKEAESGCPTGTLYRVEQNGDTNASPVVWPRKKNGDFRLCAY